MEGGKRQAIEFNCNIKENLEVWSLMRCMHLFMLRFVFFRVYFLTTVTDITTIIKRETHFKSKMCILLIGNFVGELYFDNVYIRIYYIYIILRRIVF